ncbi:hypothetical protein T1E_1704 [Pseudomonas putida DOT-T1E]|uniref:Uncharacterized protein n=1 Tax=Pseudomonas putida (strain DOT-T1E) TaxID=1196325 RepID=I7C791_PSEPT|nr:hypothetical protein T1E_1704 [Pseudomonas putida DOT-T1E]
MKGGEASWEYNYLTANRLNLISMTIKIKTLRTINSNFVLKIKIESKIIKTFNDKHNHSNTIKRKLF